MTIYIQYKGKNVIVDTVELILIETGEIYQTVNNTDGVNIETATPEKFLLKIIDKKYRTTTYDLSDFDQYSNSNFIGLDFQKKVNPLLIGAALAAIFLFAKQKKRKVGELTVSSILPFIVIAIAILGFDIVRRLLISLGIWDGKDTRHLDQEGTNPESFWNPNYWQTVKPADKNYSFAITSTTATAWAKEIYNAFGPFNDCEECAIAVFKRCKTQANASFISWAFNLKYGQDLLTFLRGGVWPQDRLSDADVNTINNYINKLPKY